MGQRTDVNLALQALSLRRMFPDGSLTFTSAQLTWQGQVRPMETCGTYTLRLTAAPARIGKVWVVEPDLITNEDGDLPHVYSDGSLCVSQWGDFRPGMLFVDTVIPWALEWLAFYEIWRATNLWFGDGKDHLDPASQARLLHPYKPPRNLPGLKGH